MRYQMVDPWAGMIRGMGDITNTLVNNKQLERQAERDKKEDIQNRQLMQIREEEAARKQAEFKQSMLKQEYGSVVAALEALKGVKDHKTYNALINRIRKKADDVRDISPETAEYFDNIIKDIPLYDGKLAGGVSTLQPGQTMDTPGLKGMAGERDNPDSKFNAWASQEILKAIAMAKMLKGDIDKETTKFGKRTYMVPNADGKGMSKWEVESKEDEEAAIAAGGTRGTPVEEKKPKTTRQSFTDENGNVTNVIFGEDGKVVGLEPIDKDGNPIGRAGKVSEPPTTEKKVAEKTALDQATQKANITAPKFREDAIDTVKKVTGKEWDTLTEEEKAKKIETQLDKQIRQVYTGKEVVYGIDEKTGVIGWYVDNKLVLAAD